MILDWQDHEVLSIISERTNICEGQVLLLVIIPVTFVAGLVKL